MAVRGVDDVNVAPFERSSWRGQLRGRCSPPRKFMSVRVVSTGGNPTDGSKEPKEGGSCTQFGQHGTVGGKP